MSDHKPSSAAPHVQAAASAATAGLPADSQAHGPPVSRRQFAALSGTAALGALLTDGRSGVGSAGATTHNPAPATGRMADLPEPLPTFRYPLEEQTGRVYAVGSAKEATVKQLPVSEGIAGVSMRLMPGAIRELHWHALAAEWAIVLTGNCQTTTFDPEGRSEINNFGPGDVWYFPRGYAHSIQGLGPGECHFVLIFDNGHFSEYGTFSITDWASLTNPKVLAQVFGVSEAAFAGLKKGELYIGPGRVPPRDATPLPNGSAHDAPLTHKFRLLAQAPRSIPGGTVRVVSSVEFPISATFTGAYLTMAPRGIRTMHWHPNADEWQYYVAGQARVTVFGSSGRIRSEDVTVGDVCYIPRGYGHHIENVGTGECHFIAGFNSGIFQETDFSDWMKNVPPALVTDNLGIPEETVARFVYSGPFAPG